jgi:hypothetical protein
MSNPEGNVFIKAVKLKNKGDQVHFTCKVICMCSMGNAVHGNVCHLHVTVINVHDRPIKHLIDQSERDRLWNYYQTVVGLHHNDINEVC